MTMPSLLRFTIVSVIIWVINGPQSFAGEDLKKFFTRYEMQRDNDGQLIAVHDRSLSYKNFSLKHTLDQSLLYLHQLALAGNENDDVRKIVSELELSFNSEMLELDNIIIDRTEKKITTIKNLTSLAFARNNGIGLQELLKDPKWQDFTNALEEEIQALPLTNRILAFPQEKFYFYKRDLFRTIFNGAASLVKSFLPFGAWFDVVNFFYKRAQSLVAENYQYHQELLLYYITNYSAGDLKITEHERRLILSSLMDANLNMLYFWKPITGSRDWEGFGIKDWNLSLNKVEKRVKKFSKRYKKVENDFGPYFASAITKKGKNVVVNFNDAPFYLLKIPSISYIFAHPNLITLERGSYELLKIALKFIPIGAVSTIGESILNFRYKRHVISEAQAFAYLESTIERLNDDDTVANLRAMQMTFLRQSVNPLILYSLRDHHGIEGNDSMGMNTIFGH